MLLTTTWPHRALTLVGTTFLLFEVVFIQFFIGEYWFSIDLAIFGVPTVLALLPIAHFLLIGLESRFGCGLFGWILKGKPPVAYRKWVLLDEESFAFGTRFVRYSVVDELELTLLGNLRAKTRAVSGAAQAKPDVVISLPFGITSRENQKQLVERIQQQRSDVVLNKRLQKSLAAPVLKGAGIGMASGAVAMFVVLLDVGWGSFWYLDMMKHYHLCAVAARDQKLEGAQRELEVADDIRSHPFPLSWVAHKFVTQHSAASIYGARAEALWRMGRRAEAIEDARKASEHEDHSEMHALRLARYLGSVGKMADARVVLEKQIEKHKKHLLPRLYLVANAKQTSEDAARLEYEKQHDQTVKEFFETEPRWPPGGDLFFHELIRQSDMQYVFRRLLDMKPD